MRFSAAICAVFIFELGLTSSAFGSSLVVRKSKSILSDGSYRQKLGKFCERLAIKELTKAYDMERHGVFPNRVITFDSRKREIDAIIFERGSRKILMLAEIKCYKKEEDGITSGIAQLKSLLRMLNYFENREAIIRVGKHGAEYELSPETKFRIYYAPKSSNALDFFYEYDNGVKIEIVPLPLVYSKITEIFESNWREILERRVHPNIDCFSPTSAN